MFKAVEKANLEQLKVTLQYVHLDWESDLCGVKGRLKNSIGHDEVSNYSHSALTPDRRTYKFV
jgi:hypothetical protein